MASPDTTPEKTEDTTAPAPAKSNIMLPTNTSPSGTSENRSNMPPEQRPPGDLRRRGSRTKREGPFVKYVGPAAQREISGPAWKSLAIPLKSDEGQKEGEERPVAASHYWNVGNDKMIESKHFSDHQLDYLLIDDLQQGTNAHAFLLVDYDKDDTSDNPQLIQVAYQ